MKIKDAIKEAHEIDLEAISNCIEDKILTDDELIRLKDMNKKYTHVSIGGKQRIAILKPCIIHVESYSFESIHEFYGYFLHCDKIAGLNAGAAWLKWKGKTFKPDGIGFYPSNNCPKEVFNLYQGVKVKADASKSCDLYLNHMNKVICAGDKRAFNYFIGWLAHLIQHPEDKPSVAIVMKSIEGTGKGTMVKPLLQILGAHGVQINGAGQVGGRFNATMDNKLLVFADEVDLTHPVTANKFKGLISESVINLERKGIDPEPMPNYARFIFASNHDNVINAGLRERRYLVLEPNPDKAQDTEYFNALYGWISNGGASGLLYYLQNYDLKDFTTNHAPATKALIDEKLASLRPAEQYIYEQLLEDKPFLGVIRLPASETVRSFELWCDQHLDSVTPAQARSMIGKVFSRMKIPVHGRSGRGTGKYYDVENIELLKVRFSKMLSHEVDDLF